MRPDKAILGDKVGDYDGGKVVGVVLVIVSIIGCFMQLPGWEAML